MPSSLRKLIEATVGAALIVLALWAIGAAAGLVALGFRSVAG